MLYTTATVHLFACAGYGLDLLWPYLLGYPKDKARSSRAQRSVPAQCGQHGWGTLLAGWLARWCRRAGAAAAWAGSMRLLEWSTCLP